MSNAATAHIFIDTNTALHFKRPDQIDWSKLTGTREVVLVAAPILLRELEHQKIVNGSRKLRERAGDYIKWLHPFVRAPETEVRSGVRWLFLPDEPQVDFAAERLSQTIADDHLIASVLHYTRQCGVNAYVATADLGLEVKLKARGIDVLELPEDLRLLAEPDPLERENRELQRHIARIETRMPKLSVAFEGGTQNHALQLQKVDAVSVTSLVQVQTDHPYLSKPEEAARPSEGLASPLANIQRLALSAKRVDAYNEKLEKYFRDYQAYLDRHADWQETVYLHHLINFVVTNDGTSPASNIDVDLFFPEGTAPVDEHDISKKPKPPDAPRRPQVIDIGGFDSPDYLSSLMPRNLHQMVNPNYDGVPIIRQDEKSVRISYSSLKHGFSSTTDLLFFRFITRETVAGFSLGYHLSADELPDAMEGELHFRIDDGQA